MELRLLHLKFKEELADALLKAEIPLNYFLYPQLENCSYMSAQETKL